MAGYPVDVAAAWQAAANAQDVDTLLALSDPNIEIAGPRGSGVGHQLLREWIARAGLTLSTLRVFARGDTVVFAQRGIWRSMDSGGVTGERSLASLFQIRDGHIVKVARFDDLAAACGAAGLGSSEEIARPDTM